MSCGALEIAFADKHRPSQACIYHLAKGAEVFHPISNATPLAAGTARCR